MQEEPDLTTFGTEAASEIWGDTLGLWGFYGAHIGVILGLYWDNGKDDGNYSKPLIMAKKNMEKMKNQMDTRWR